MALSRCKPLIRNFRSASALLCENLQPVFRSSQSSRILGEQPLCRFPFSSPPYFSVVVRGFRTGTRAVKTKPAQKSPHGSYSAVKSLAYVTGFCTCSFAGAMIWNYENWRKFFSRQKHEKAPQKDKKNLELRRHLDIMMSQIWTIGIIAANAGVWIMWRFPRLQETMIRYFSSAPGRPLASLTLSSFSHIHFFHLFLNMYVLLSFMPLTMKLFGREQFLAFYLSAGTVSAFTSVAVNQLLRRPSLMSVGASGAIMGLLGAVAVTYPEAKLQIAFISDIFPHSFSASTGLKAIIAFDLLGLALGWRVLDHAGHLGGVLFGLLYAKYGKNLVWGKTRDKFVKSWHELRGKP